MALVIGSAQDKKYGFAAQTTWGTVIADNAAMTELSTAHFTIPQDVTVKKLGGAHGRRIPNYTDFVAFTGMANPQFDISQPAMPGDFDFFLYSATQKVTEGATTPFSKAFVFANPQPDFTTSAGFFATITEHDPVSANSWKVKDCICKDLTMTCKAGGLLEFKASMMGRGVPITSTPTGTWTTTTQSFWEFNKIARATINYGSGAQNMILKQFEIKIVVDIQPVGSDGSGGFSSYGLIGVKPTFKLHLLKETIHETARTNFANGTGVQCRIGWGNATAGTDSGDLDFAWYGKLTNVKNDNENVYGMEFDGDILVSGANEPLTITMANAIDRTW